MPEQTQQTSDKARPRQEALNATTSISRYPGARGKKG